MTDDEAKELCIMTEQELNDMNARWERTEEAGIVETSKYFDRMHDKLFSINSLLIAGYFALIAVRTNVPDWSIVIPIINSAFLLLIDYRMMIRARLQANITTVSAKDRQRYGRITNSTNLYSLLSIGSTLTVTIFFVYFLLLN